MHNDMNTCIGGWLLNNIPFAKDVVYWIVNNVEGWIPIIRLGCEG